MIGAEYSYLWIKEPDKLFEEFTRYQEIIDARFREVSDELRPISTHITANLPLLDNYRAIINDSQIQEWLKKLKEETQKNEKVKGLKLSVDRYIYIQGKIRDKRWEIEKSYLSEVCSFLQKDFFSGLPENYIIWVVLCDRNKMEEQYSLYQGSKIEFPYEEIISNWVWFECKDG
ncbi:MAG: hypothetical protein QMC83_10310, partial [Thermodesulfovibrionales bacterium]|nr:hypothetical protein [Thermodesulfovibrionales bacterium]